MGLRGGFSQVMPAAVDVVLSDPVVGPWRAEATRSARGVVVEVGFGSGLSLPHYSADVQTVLGVEPSNVAWDRASRRIADFDRPVQRIGTDAAELALADHSIDTVVSCWTMCTIPRLDQALAEFARVLRPGGSLWFVEHSLSPEPKVARWQGRLRAPWARVAGGCQLDRDIPALLEQAGFRLDQDHRRYIAPVPGIKIFGWLCSGQATPVTD